jgi:signal transduction histidine kinase
MLTLVAATVVALVGALILWSNPSRLVNRMTFTCSLHMASWLYTLYRAVSIADGLWWLKVACAISAFIPFHYWLVKESIVGAVNVRSRVWISYCITWIGICALLGVAVFTDYFIPPNSTPTNRLHGWAYYGYIITVLGLYGFVFRDSYRALTRCTGLRRLELQVWLGGGCAMAFTVLGLMALNAVTHDRIYIRLQPLVILVCFAGTVMAVTTYRIFDARQILLVVIEKCLLIAVVSLIAYVTDLILALVLPKPFDLLATVALALWVAALLTAWFDRIFQFYPQATSARQAAFSAAQRETRIDTLESSFRGILQGWGQSERAIILSGDKEVIAGGGLELPGDGTIVKALRHLRWVTPERLARERSTPERKAISDFILTQGLGVLVFAEGPALSVVIGVGMGAARRPFTYPQVTQLLELASIMEGALERAHFSAKVQHAEQLATVGLLGASLAHEIRNPLVSIKTFVQLLPTHHHDPLFREKFFRLIGDEVGRIDQLTEQLLDLASPRTYSAEVIELHPVLRASLDLVAAKAAHKNVQFLTEFNASPDRAYTDASAAKQVMLNLCFNAIQAAESREANERWIKIGTRNTPTGIEMAIADSGPGVAAEIRPRLFQPFQTTKSTGFGLGLAICSDILANLNASISVDPPEAGRGATFRVTFPCQPLSS